jgi:hypothetical protein
VETERRAAAPGFVEIQHCHRPLLLVVEAVAQRNSGVHRSQSPLEAILTEVIYGSLGAFDGQAGLI